MRNEIAVAIAATTLVGCSMVPYYSEVKAVADAGIATAVQDRKEFNDKKLAINLVALCDSSIGAVNRHPDSSVRDFVNRLCGGDGEGVTMDRLTDLLRTLDRLKSAGS
jgi:hypothetical protein